jgi:ATP-dependent DNA helicase PIF1
MKRTGDESIQEHEPTGKKCKIDLTVDEEVVEQRLQKEADEALEREINAIINEPPPHLKQQQQQPQQQPQALSPSQQKALDMVNQGLNVFITGNAGSGKSYLIAVIIRTLEAQRKRVVLTASTGVASWNIGGVTVHSFSGLGTANKDIKAYTAGLKWQPEKRKEWIDLDVLIIDEISMLSVDFMIKLDAMAKFARSSHLPFGGLQLIMTGDYFQLPSVEKNFEEFDEATGEARPRFPFQSPLWTESRIHTICLRENFRQQTDRAFFEMLERIKVAKPLPSDESLLEKRLIERHPRIDESDLTKLCSRRATAQAINAAALANIQSEEHEFIGIIEEYDSKGQKKTPSNNTTKGQHPYPVDIKLTLKAGAEVLLCVNMTPAGLFNGSRGKVVDFRRDPYTANSPLYPFVEFENGPSLLVRPNRWENNNKKRLVSTFTQIPLILRYAITIHKSQGLTLSKVLVMMDFFENGQAYVALSRVRALTDLYLQNVNMETIMASQAVIDFYTSNNLL